MSKPLVQSTGRRKTAVARVRFRTGSGKIVINGREIGAYFPSQVHQMHLSEPLRITETAEVYDVDATVDGGGMSGQAGALRLGIARALLQKPQYLFLDEATASLDEPSEAALYTLLEKALPSTTIVSIGHRSTLRSFHDRGVALARDGDRFALVERAGAAAS